MSNIIKFNSDREIVTEQNGEIVRECNDLAEMTEEMLLDARKEIANVIGCTVGTVCQKLNGKSAFTLPEAKTIKDFLAVDISIEDLFASNDT